MNGADLALALATGMVAAVNPCGFALLPAYLSFLILDGTSGRRQAVVRALGLTAAMTGGFVLVFGAFGLLVAPAAGAIAEQLPWVTIVIGVVLLVLGGWLLAGREIPGLVPPMAGGRQVTRSAWSMTLFGASYAVASLSCTIGPFLAIVVTSFTADDAVAGVGLFLAYALGMGLVVGTVALAFALARASLITRVRRATPVIARAAGALLVLAGAYVAYYGWYQIRVFRGEVTADPVVDGFGRVQGAVATWLDEVGAVPIALVFVALLAAGMTAVGIRQRLRR